MSPVRFRRSLGFALAGVRLAWREQRNFRIEVVIAVAVLLLAWWTSATVAPILMMTGLVLAFELTNSAVEALVDLV
ncbi:MAG TPA: diacylglycerol kinase, partial [Trueperaceae bacterium]|nr:diacylglycerol kinase [Trueperaceae bacterium]